MVAEWIATTLKVIHTVVSVVGTAATAVACPPCVPAAAGFYSLMGTAIDLGTKNSDPTDQQSQYKAIKDGLDTMTNSLHGMNGTLIENQGMLKEINGTVMQNQDILNGINVTVLQNQQILNGINVTVIQNQEMLTGIQVMLKANAEENRLMLKDIQETLRTFEENMNRNFNELKVFMIEKDFTEKVQIPMQHLWEAMESANESPTEYSVADFISAYKSLSPRKILSEFLIRLNHPHTNPIVAAMENDVLNSRKILDNYMYLFSHLIFKVLAVEGFYFGVSDLPKNSTVEYMNAIAKNIDAALTSFRRFVTSYKMAHEKYWPDAVNQTIVSNNVGPDVAKVADPLKQQLDGIYTTDVFSIYVYHCSQSLEQCNPHPLRTSPLDTPKERNEKIGRYLLSSSNNATRTVAAVLRSEKYHEIPAQAVSLVRTSFRSYASLAHLASHPVSHVESVATDPFIEQLDSYFKKNQVTGFVVNNVKPETRFTNNGTSILMEKELQLLPTYYGLGWI